MTTGGLRFAPWVMSLLSLWLFWQVARRFVDGLPLVATISLFALSPSLIGYGSAVKPYGGDVTVGLFITWLALRWRERPHDLTRGVVAGLAGGAGLLLSFPAVPTAAIVGTMLLVTWLRGSDRPPVAPIACLGAGWVLGAALATFYATTRIDPATDAFMQDFWKNGFPSSVPGLAKVWWAVASVFRVFSQSLVGGVPPGPLIAIVVTPLAFALVGLAFGHKRVPLANTLLLLAPLAAGLGSAFAGLMPYDHRLGLFSGWPTLVLAGMGLCALRDAARGRWVILPRSVAVLTSLPLGLIVLLLHRPPYQSQGGVLPREVLEQLATRVAQEDEIYVYTQGRHDMVFYGGSAGLTDWVQGERHYDAPRGYLEEVDALRGRPRVWFFWVQLREPEPAFIHRYLSTIGTELERIPEGELGRTGAVLYDLSDPDLLQSAAASTFPLGDLE